MRPAADEEVARVEPLLARACAAAGIERGRLMLRMEDSNAINAYATAGHLVCVTTGALRLPDPQLEAVLGHELGHHSELHPLISALTWWLQLPAVPLKALLRVLRRLIAGVAARFGGLARPIGVVLLLLLWLVAFQVLWLVWVADVLAAFVSRRTELAADARAVEFGYGPELLEAYATLAAGSEPKTRLQRMTDFHPPMEERIEQVRERLEEAAAPDQGRRTHAGTRATRARRSG